MAAEVIECSGCGKPLSDHMHLCDLHPDKVWCCECFDDTACGQGNHGDECETIAMRLLTAAELGETLH